MVSRCPQNIMGTKYFISLPINLKPYNQKEKHVFSKGIFWRDVVLKTKLWPSVFRIRVEINRIRIRSQRKYTRFRFRKTEFGSKSYILFCSLYNEIQHRYYRDFGSRCSDRIRIRTYSKFEIFNLFTFRNQI